MSKTLQYFKEITKYPRPSKHEEQIREFLISWSQERRHHHAVDGIGNLVVYVDAKNSTVTTPVILQAHMDMVCVKTPESTHDFSVDPIEIYEQDGYLHARDTTLGADNGIGVALAMAASEFASHPPLELAFTVDEEAGMSGVEGLDFSLLSGRDVINLDMETDDEICISSAGGIGVIATKRLEYVEQTDALRYTLTISGMQGGHSGCEIHQNRGNALAAILEFVSRCDAVTAVYDIRGGVACNVIPSKAEAVIGIVDKWACIRAIELFVKETRWQFDCPDITYSLEEDHSISLPIADGKQLCADIAHIRVGVYAMSEKIPDLVETSMNLGTVRIEDGLLELVYLARSSVNNELYRVFDETKAYFLERGYEVAHDRWYLGWQDDPQCGLAQLVSREMGAILGRAPKMIAVHAGLECGAMVSGLGDGAHAVAIGPNVYEVHSVHERVEIASIERVERMLEGVLAGWR